MRLRFYNQFVYRNAETNLQNTFTWSIKILFGLIRLAAEVFYKRILSTKRVVKETGNINLVVQVGLISSFGHQGHLVCMHSISERHKF